MKDLLIQKLLSTTLRNVADSIENGTCTLTPEQTEKYLGMMAIEPISKDQACQYLGISRATFDNYVREGKLPKGKKQRGFKELSWDKGELMLCSIKLKDK